MLVEQVLMHSVFGVSRSVGSCCAPQPVAGSGISGNGGLSAEPLHSLLSDWTVLLPAEPVTPALSSLLSSQRGVIASVSRAAVEVSRWRRSTGSFQQLVVSAGAVNPL